MLFIRNCKLITTIASNLLDSNPINFFLFQELLLLQKAGYIGKTELLQPARRIIFWTIRAYIIAVLHCRALYFLYSFTGKGY